MKFIKFSKCLKAMFILFVPILISGCGSSGESAPNGIVTKGASVAVISSGNGEYVIQGVNLDGFAGLELTVNYDSSILSTPTVTKGGLVSDFIIVSNTNTPGSIKIAMVSARDISGSGQIATVSFAAVTGAGSVSVASANMTDSNGKQIPLTFQK